jgi:hypothetical protein
MKKRSVATTYACGPIGAVLLRALCLLPTPMFVQPALAGELGNIIAPKYPEIEKMSAAASAAAIQGLENILAGLRESELKNVDGRVTNFGAAASALADAAKKMSQIPVQQVNQNIDWSRVDEGERNYTLYMLQHEMLSKSLPENVSELYKIFLALTEKMGKRMDEASKNKDARTSREVIQKLAQYLSFGDIVSEIIEKVLNS